MTPQTPERSETNAALEELDAVALVLRGSSQTGILANELSDTICRNVSTLRVALAQLSAVQPSAEALDLSVFEGHTPGPWRADDGAERGVFSAEGSLLAVVRRAYQGRDLENHRLIAAAPALLAEVIRLRAHLSPSSVSSVTREEGDWINVRMPRVIAEIGKRAAESDASSGVEREIGKFCRDALNATTPPQTEQK